MRVDRHQHLPASDPRTRLHEHVRHPPFHDRAERLRGGRIEHEMRRQLPRIAPRHASCRLHLQLGPRQRFRREHRRVALHDRRGRSRGGYLRLRCAAAGTEHQACTGRRQAHGGVQAHGGPQAHDGVQAHGGLRAHGKFRHVSHGVSSWKRAASIGNPTARSSSTRAICTSAAARSAVLRTSARTRSASSNSNSEIAPSR